MRTIFNTIVSCCKKPLLRNGKSGFPSFQSNKLRFIGDAGDAGDAMRELF